MPMGYTCTRRLDIWSVEREKSAGCYVVLNRDCREERVTAHDSSKKIIQRTPAFQRRAALWHVRAIAIGATASHAFEVGSYRSTELR